MRIFHKRELIVQLIVVQYSKLTIFLFFPIWKHHFLSRTDVKLFWPNVFGYWVLGIPFVELIAE